MRRYLIIGMLLTAMAVEAAAPKWELLDAPRGYLEQIDIDSFDLRVAEGNLYLATRKPVTVKIFTILGQLIVQDNLSAGQHRIKMPQKGIYIVKIGTTTRRITI